MIFPRVFVLTTCGSCCISMRSAGPWEVVALTILNDFFRCVLTARDKMDGYEGFAYSAKSFNRVDRLFFVATSGRSRQPARLG